MASKRISKTAIDWKRFQKLIPSDQHPNYSQLLAKNFQYVSRVTSLPENLPKIDFDAYKKLVPEKSATIDKFQSAYGSFQVPFPKDSENLLAKIESQAKEQEDKIKQHLVNVDKYAAELKKQREVITSLPPLEEMTLELSEYYFPENQNKSNDELFGECPHAKMVEEEKKAKLLGKGHDHH